MWYWHKDRHIHQWNRTKSLKINLCIYGQLLFDKNAQRIQLGKINLFNNGAGATACSQKRKIYRSI